MATQEDSYFVIHASENGISVEEINRVTLTNRINPVFEYYGTNNFVDVIREKDPNYWGNSLLIIKGRIVVPKPKEVITRFDID